MSAMRMLRRQGLSRGTLTRSTKSAHLAILRLFTGPALGDQRPCGQPEQEVARHLGVS